MRWTSCNRSNIWSSKPRGKMIKVSNNGLEESRNMWCAALSVSGWTIPVTWWGRARKLVLWRIWNKGDPVSYQKNLKPCKEIWVKLGKIRPSNRLLMHSAVNPLFFKNQGSDAGRQPTVAGLPATVGCRPKINELIKLYTGYSTVPACI